MKPLFSVAAIASILFSIPLVSCIMSKAPTVTAAQIQALQADSENSGQFLIVDVRDKIETDVSIIPGAITQVEFEKVQQNHPGKTVIAYCTFGHRSGIYAQKLRGNGWNAWNYQGGILDWCNNGLSVVTPRGHNTKRVHTYNSSYHVAGDYQAVY